MGNKPVILLIGFLIIGITGISEPNSSFSENISSNDENKIYTVTEAADLLKANPVFFKNKVIQLEAYVVDAVEGTGCNDYVIFADRKYTEGPKSTSLLLSGPTLTVSPDLSPVYHAIYQGHFYDESANACGADGWKRFVIDRKIKEIQISPDAKL